MGKSMIDQADAASHDSYMQQAIGLAEQAEQIGEVPVGALLLLDGEIVGRGFNRSIVDSDPTAHAEILALRDAGQALGTYRIPGSVLYVTLEPCAMCAGAMVHARVARCVYGAPDPKSGAAGTVTDVFNSDGMNHRVAVTGGVLAQQCGEQLRAFFRARR